MTIGVFDAVHLGHRELIQRIVRRGPNPTVITFRENPKKRVFPNLYDGDLYSFKQKLTVFDSLGVSRVVLIDFSEEFCKLKGTEFLDLLEDRGKMAFLAIGINFRCGYQQDTGADLVKEINEDRGIPTELVAPVVPEGETAPVSSSIVRAAVKAGDIGTAAALMGRNVELDLSDIKGVFSLVKEREGLVYDFRSVNRIIPTTGEYHVLIYPGGVVCVAEMYDGKVSLPKTERDYPAESLEFIKQYPI
jgi:riboflavin kinase/FMN adenylyltransferase